ncbi:MAG: hypothetical protein ACJA0U_001676 [Salibacteraceae bacterium]|jgi:hypothetical protein
MDQHQMRYSQVMQTFSSFKVLEWNIHLELVEVFSRLVFGMEILIIRLAQHIYEIREQQHLKSLKHQLFKLNI